MLHQIKTDVGWYCRMGCSQLLQTGK